MQHSHAFGYPRWPPQYPLQHCISFRANGFLEAVFPSSALVRSFHLSNNLSQSSLSLWGLPSFLWCRDIHFTIILVVCVILAASIDPSGAFALARGVDGLLLSNMQQEEEEDPGSQLRVQNKSAIPVKDHHGRADTKLVLNKSKPKVMKLNPPRVCQDDPADHNRYLAEYSWDGILLFKSHNMTISTVCISMHIAVLYRVNPAMSISFEYQTRLSHTDYHGTLSQTDILTNKSGDTLGSSRASGITVITVQALQDPLF